MTVVDDVLDSNKAIPTGYKWTRKSIEKSTNKISLPYISSNTRIYVSANKFRPCTTILLSPSIITWGPVCKRQLKESSRLYCPWKVFPRDPFR